MECFKKQLDKHVNTYIRKIIPQGTTCEMTQGRVIVQFCINTNGSVTVLATRGKDESLKREAKRIIESLPCLIAGQQNGKTVAVIFAYPIHF